jgi:hypothetical protein
MLRNNVIQWWHALSIPAMEKLLYDGASIRHFVCLVFEVE